MSLGSFLKAHREAVADPLSGRPYTQAGLAKAVGVSRPTIAAIEAGNIATLTPEIANRLARLLRISVEALLREVGFEVGSPTLAPEEADLVELLRRVPQPFQAAFLASTRGLARELSELPSPTARPAGRRAG